jgi:outer membrane receptor protein involved in Fe transport
MIRSAAAQDAPEPPTFGARARVREEARVATQPTEAETTALEEHLGPSFSVVESLPGVVPVFSGVPYLIVRGSTPSGTATYYDGVLIPSLFHIALGPSVVNPRLVGETDFYPGVSPARFGRHTGGSLVVQPPARRLGSDGAQRELKLTLLDANGYLYAPEINTAFAWRVGDPALLMNVLGLDATLKYFDYQVRHESWIGENTRLMLLGFGAGDELGDRTAPEDDISLHWHRWLARITRRFERAELGSELAFGYDASTLGRELEGNGVRIMPSLWFVQRGEGVRFRLGADMMGTHVNLRRRSSDAMGGAVLAQDDSLLNPEDLLAGQPYESVPTRATGGIYTELSFEPFDRFYVDLGARADAWLAGSEAKFALSPSLQLRYALTPGIELHAAIGLSHQAQGSPVPLPSLGDVALNPGLEKSIHGDVGVSWRLPADLQLEAAYFHHRYIDVVYLELVLDCEGNTDPVAAQTLSAGANSTSICRGHGLPTGDGTAQGFELYLKRNLTERVSGFVSYTLAFADAVARDGTHFTPQSDVRHLANAVLHFDLGAGFALGVRLHYRTGKMAVNRLPDLPPRRVETRLPSFFRADLRGSYTWKVSFGRLEASIGVQNVTASSEPTHRDCSVDPLGDFSGNQVPVLCSIHYQRAILLPNLGIRAEM